MDMVALLCVIAVPLCWFIVRFKKRRVATPEHKCFRLSERDWVLDSSDLGGKKPSIYVSFKQLHGAPDSVFTHKKSSHRRVVAEYKERTFRGRVRYSEYYQVIAYIGCLQRKWRRETVTGVLAYRNKVINIDPDDEVFLALLQMRDEPERIGVFVNKTPLHKRGVFKRTHVNGYPLVV